MAALIVSPYYKKLVLWFILAALVILGIYIRFADLDADPPLYFEGSSQSLSTDPYQYTYHARNKVLFGQWDPLGVEKWKVFQPTLVSALSYIIFSLFGVSRYNANLTGLLLSLSTILFFVLAMRKLVGFRGIFLILLLLLFNKTLFVHNRLPYNENGMLFWLSLLFFVFVHYRHYWGGRIALGILISLAGLTGKIFGFLFFIPLITCLWMEKRENRGSGIVTILVSSLVTAGVYIILAYGGNLKLISEYIFQQSLGLYGFPDSLKSPFAFTEKLISFGNDSLLYYLAPAVGLAGFLALVNILCAFSGKSLKENLPILFLIIWFFAGHFFFMIENYRPLRYIYMLYFPLAGLAGYVFSSKFHISQDTAPRKSLTYHIFLFFLIWIFLEQVGFGIYRERGFIAVYKNLVWGSIIPAILITISEIKFGFLRSLLSKGYVKGSMMVLVIAILFWNFGAGYWVWQTQKSFNIKQAGQDLGEILNEKAVICGPMAPTLLLENRLKGMIYAVGISSDDSVLFDKYPVTHFAIGADVSGLIVDAFPQLGEAPIVSDYWVRDADMAVVRISGLTGNKIAAAYQLTDFEIARNFTEGEVYDSALFYMEKFSGQYPNNKSALKLLSFLYGSQGEIDKGLAAIKKASLLYNTDFSIILALATYYQNIYAGTGQSIYSNLTKETYFRVIQMNPHQADEANAAAQKISESQLEKK